MTHPAADMIQVRSPATGEPLAEIPVSSPEQIRAAMEAARAAYPAWRDKPVTARLAYVRKLKNLLIGRLDEVVSRVVFTGMPIARQASLDAILRAFRYSLLIAAGATLLVLPSLLVLVTPKTQKNVIP